MNPWKPWFIFRPSQIIRRLTFQTTSSHRQLEAAWGGRLLARDDDHIGQCLGTTGIYDLGVSELLFRLIRPGDLVIDAGANIGYMSVLAATAGARVISYEPNPELLPILRQNVGAKGDVRPVALGARPHTSMLIVPDASDRNTGLGRLGSEGESGGVPVQVETLDAELHGREATILKLDVEGAEHGYGYEIYSIGWTLTGPALGNRTTVPAHAHYEAPSYLATLAPDEVRAACAKRGWMALRPQPSPKPSALSPQP
jgi:FkbM family methyltransferase